jgi:3-oxoacyl-[acyl-carrier-protein] synthase-3
MEHFGVTIAGTGHYVPERVLTNLDLEKMVDTSDEWIRTRTGICERHIAADDQPTSVLAFEASKRALQAAGLAAEDLDLIIVATLTPDTQFPNTACHLQRRLGAAGAACFSMEAACSGFLYAFETAAGLMSRGRYRHALIVGAEKLTSIVDWTDRNTCVLFGDGAGAMVLSQCPEEQSCLVASSLGSDGNYSDLLHVPGGGTAMPMTQEVLEQGQNFLKMNGREIFKLAVNAMVTSSQDVMSESQIGIDQVRWLVPHQANTRIILAVGKRLGIPEERVYMNLERYGNTSAATLPICLDEIARGGKVQSGDYLLLTAFGGGLTWGGLLVRWP